MRVRERYEIEGEEKQRKRGWGEEERINGLLWH